MAASLTPLCSSASPTKASGRRSRCARPWSDGMSEYWHIGILEYWNTGMSKDEMHHMRHRRIKNRGYQQLRVWQDAIDLYVIVCRTVKGWPFELKKVASQ